MRLGRSRFREIVGTTARALLGRRVGAPRRGASSRRRRTSAPRKSPRSATATSSSWSMRSASGCTTCGRPLPERSRMATTTSTARRSTRPLGRGSACSRRFSRTGADGCTHRGLRDHRRPPERRARQPGRLHRLALPAALRLGRDLRVAPRDSGERPLDASAGGRLHVPDAARIAATRSCSRPSSRPPPGLPA